MTVAVREALTRTGMEAGCCHPARARRADLAPNRTFPTVTRPKTDGSVRTKAKLGVGVMTVLCAVSLPAYATIVTTGDVSPAGLGPGDTTASPITIGGDFTTPGNGTITIDDGSTLTTPEPEPIVNIAPLPGSAGTATVSGTDSGTPSTWRLEGAEAGDGGAFVTVGRGGDAEFNIDGGAKVEIDSSGRPLGRFIPGLDFPAGFQVARDAGSTGTINLTGSGSELSVTSDFAFGLVGRDGEGEMNITNDATLSFTGINSDFNVASDFASGEGTLNVNTGGSVSGPVFLDVGGSPGALGVVNLDGATSSITLQGACTADCPTGFSFPNQGAFLTVGANEGTGEVNVTGGAKFTIDSSATANAEFAGFSLGGSSILGPMGDGTLTVDGSGSELRVKGDRALFSVGRLEQGLGELTVSNGGKVILENLDGASTGFLADRIAARGIITVSGSSSLLDAGSFLGVGVDGVANDAGDGRLILDEGTVRADLLVVGGGGTVEGNGTLEASTPGATQVRINRGTIAPGLSTGEIVVEGDLLVQDGRVLMEANSLTDLDKIHVTGDATFNGGFIDVILGFIPDPGDVLSFFDVDGTVTVGDGFGGINALAAPGVDIPAGTLATVMLGDERFQARVPAPEPTTLALIGIGLAALGFRRRAPG